MTGLAGLPAHVTRFGVNTDLFRIAVIQEEIEIFNRMLIIFLAVYQQQRSIRLLEPALVLERQIGSRLGYRTSIASEGMTVELK